jgi:hypothetical protein
MIKPLRISIVSSAFLWSCVALAQVGGVSIAQNTLKNFQSTPLSSNRASVPTVNQVLITKYQNGSVTLSLAGFNSIDHKITDGEYFDDEIKTDVENGALEVTAARKASKSPVDWLKSPNSKIGGMSYQLSANPKALHFAFVGDLILNLTGTKAGAYQLVCKGIALAQGRAGAANDWWFFSNVASPGNWGGLNYYHDVRKTLSIRCESADNSEFDVNLNSGTADNAFALMDAVRVSVHK